MSDVISGLRQVIQDLVARELKAHSFKLEALQRQGDALQKLVETQHGSMMKTLDAFRAEMRTEFALLKANNQMEVYRQVAPLSERLAVVESRLDQR